MKRSKSRFSVVYLPVILILAITGPLNGFTAGDLNFFVNNEFLLNLNRTNENSTQFYETLAVFGNIKKFSFNLVIRANNFFKREPNITLEDMNFDLYRKSLHYNSAEFDLTLGDFYSVLGHGLLLSIQKNDEVFRERTIFGTDLKFRRGRFNIRGIAGEITDDTSNQQWRLIGGESSLGIGRHRIGAGFSYINDHQTLRDLGDRLTISFSLRGNKILGDLSYYAEAALLDFAGDWPRNGNAVYSNLTYSRSRTTILVEYRRYKDFDNELNNPPVADREDEFTSLNDSEGLRVLAQYTVPEPEISLYLNIGGYREYGDKGTHFYGGISALDIKDRLSFNISYGIRNIIYPVKKTAGDISFQISDLLNLNLQLSDKRYRDRSFFFNEQDHVIQLSHSKGFTLFFSHQYSHNRIIGLNHFFNGGLSAQFRNDLEIRVRYGTVRGGQLCSGGQCYFVPPFRGFNFALLKTFR